MGNITSYVYDLAGRLTTETNVLGSRSYQYDLVGNRTQGIDRNDRATIYGYDNLDRLISEIWVGGNKSFTYTYDRNSNLVSADDGNIRYEYGYDNTEY